MKLFEILPFEDDDFMDTVQEGIQSALEPICWIIIGTGLIILTKLYVDMKQKM